MVDVVPPDTNIVAQILIKVITATTVYLPTTIDLTSSNTKEGMFCANAHMLQKQEGLIKRALQKHQFLNLALSRLKIKKNKHKYNSNNHKSKEQGNKTRITTSIW